MFDIDMLAKSNNVMVFVDSINAITARMKALSHAYNRDKNLIQLKIQANNLKQETDRLINALNKELKDGR